MGGPEHLEVKPQRPPRRVVLPVTAVLVVALGFGLVWEQRRSDQSVPTPTPIPVSATSPTEDVSSRRLPTSPPTSPPTSSPSGPVTLWPGQATGRSQPVAPAVPAGTLYARSTDALYAINTQTGATIVTAIRIATTDAVAMAPLADGVAIRPSDDSSGLLVRDGSSPVDLPGQLKNADEILPGPPGRVWALKRVDDYTSPDTTATLVDSDGHSAGTQLTAAGSYTTYGAGGLLLFDVGGTWQTYPQPLTRVTTGNVTSVGPHHYQLLNCDSQHRCTETLLDRRTQQRTRLPPRERSYSNSALSPEGTYLASLTGFGDTTEPQTTITRVADNRVLCKLPTPANATTTIPGSIAWLSDRWLAAISEGRLRLYDTTNNQVLSPDLPVEGLLQLSWRPS